MEKQRLLFYAVCLLFALAAKASKYSAYVPDSLTYHGKNCVSGLANNLLVDKEFKAVLDTEVERDRGRLSVYFYLFIYFFKVKYKLWSKHYKIKKETRHKKDRKSSPF